MIDKKRVAGVLLAAGSSTRMGFDKLFYKIKGKPVLLCAAQCLANNAYIDEIVVVAGANMQDVQNLFAQNPLAKPVQIVQGGSTRAASVKAGVNAVNAKLVAVHDAARPFASEALINRTVEAASIIGAAAPAIAVKDTIKQAKNGLVFKTPPRAELYAVQTPQVFVRSEFLQALEKIGEGEYELITDDCMVMEKSGKPVKLVEGEMQNFKITTKEDLPKEESGRMLRIGHGYDVHKFAKNRKLIIGGVDIPYSKGLSGHSDADVLLHAVADAMLGALALGDIGKHFPDTDPAYSGADSMVLLSHVAKLVQDKGYFVQNVDASILCQAPKLAGYIASMRHNIAKALNISADEVSVKATTEEGLGFTGRGEGIAAHTVLLLAKLSTA